MGRKSRERQGRKEHVWNLKEGDNEEGKRKEERQLRKDREGSIQKGEMGVKKEKGRKDKDKEKARIGMKGDIKGGERTREGGEKVLKEEMEKRKKEGKRKNG